MNIMTLMTLRCCERCENDLVRCAINEIFNHYIITGNYLSWKSEIDPRLEIGGSVLVATVVF
jgi:hypothetical protein